jgi:hypothetical protein
MFGDHFYHAILRKSVAVFGTLFNDISVVRKNNDGIVKDQQKVPLSYGPKQKFLARIDQQANLNDPKVALKLPRMSFEITNMAYDSTTKMSALNKITTSSTQDSKTIVGQVTPYVVDMQLNIIAKNQDDALQILEQIVPYFQPTYNLSVRFVEDLNSSFDVPITLTSVTLQDDYEGDMTTRRSLIYTLDFSMKVKFFGPSSKKNVITSSSTDVNNLSSFGFIEEIVAESSFAIVPATGDAILVDDLITRYEFTNRGRGYTTPPNVVVSAPTGAPRTAVVTPTLVNGEITEWVINDPGLYYTTEPDVTVEGLFNNNGSIENFSTSVKAILQVKGGSNLGRVQYVNPFPITDIVTIVSTTVSAPTGTPSDFTARVEATVDDSGRLGELIPLFFGAGYESTPTVTIDEPDATTATYSVFEGVDNTDDDQIS